MIASSTLQFRKAKKSGSSIHLPDRQQRFPNLIGMPEEGHETLSKLRVAVAGCGAIGRTIAIDLARLGIAEIYLVDPKRYKEQSLLTQQISPSEVGRLKAESTAEACAEISLETTVLYYAGRFESLEHLALATVDVVIMAGDNLRLEEAIGRWTSLFRIPLIHAAVHGETLVAQVHFYSNKNASSPCPCCGWGAAEWDHHARESTFACDPASAGNSEQVPTIGTQPTTSTPSLCGLAANLASTQMLRSVLGLGKSVDDTSLQFCAFPNETATSPLIHRKSCPNNHRPYIRKSLPDNSDYSLNDLLEKTKDLWRNGDPPTFQLANLAWVEAGSCKCQSATTRLARFVSPNEPEMLCESCHAPISPQPFFTHSRASLLHLGEALKFPLRQLCSVSPEWITIGNSENAVLLT
ncbi:MAG: ThiF family adenylyltransferase [Verrucomicrobiota bacterium]